MVTSIVVEEAGRLRRELPTMGKQLVNFITCGYESSARVLVIGLYELLGNPTTSLIEPPGPLSLWGILFEKYIS
jgi:hypothetical protein